MAEVSRECNYIRPVFNENNEYEIIGGRHFLQECCVDNFVANDYKSENTKGKVKIITGANASGKSIYLKQICLISYMAQIGCFVPAEKALLPIIDRMYSRIQTVESVSTNVSAFCFDLNQVSMSVRNATARSLVALDEFGKGTELSQGLALLAATINYWLRRDTTPFLLVSTHLLSIPQFLIKTPKLEFQTFEVIVTEEKVVYTYSIKDGIAKSSLAHAVARSAGISNQILDRAKYISDKLAKGEDFEPLPNAEYDAHVAKCRAVGRAFNSIKAELRAIEDQDLRLQKFKEFLESIKDV
ncbi:hypothetical protein B4U80_01520 [Leptotrombidium deliense]|uniref:DNA mismatch repair proteins mutS family domain-containing protein n=1 Tax=Leptotrombidium deliense TaxID=299467 RepID=A0A443SPG1_9ACAR|nr:hypothetical protein B4U80_01520 [Leptotrombidium deliense]